MFELDTPHDDRRSALFWPHDFPASSSNDDQDQRVSQELLSSMSPHLRASSMPDPFLFTPSSTSCEIDQDVSLSPAAMFLSSFSPIHQSAALPDDEGEQVAGYTLGPIVGYGGFSTIRKASSSQGGIVAVKIVRRSDVTKQPDPERARQMLDHEMQVWSSLGHEHILPLFTSSHTSYADFFVTLYCPAGSLFDILKRDGRPALPQDDAGMMFRQVVRGLRYLHESAGIVHGDMKLENVLVDEMGVCKIGDFGMARKIGEFDQANGLPAVAEVVEVEEVRHHREGRGIQRFATMREKSNRSRSRTGAPLPLHMSLLRHHSGPRHRNSNPLPDPAEVTHIFPNPTFQPGSLPYAAPELLLPQSEAPSVPRPNPAQDIWALGIMLYALLTGRLPFVDSFEPRLQMKILHGVYTVPQGVGRGAERVLKGCLERSIPNRWTIEMVDEVAWGIGWGTEGDDVSFSPECGRNIQLPDTVEDSPPRRSSSRLPRSTSRSVSAVRANQRSISRPAINATHIHSNDHSSPSASLSPISPTSASALSSIMLRSASSSSSSSGSSMPMSPPAFAAPTLAESFDHPRAAGNDDVGARGRKVTPRHINVVGGLSSIRHVLLRRNSLEELHAVDEVTDLPSPMQWVLSPEAEDDSISRSRVRPSSHNFVHKDARGSERARSMPRPPASPLPWGCARGEEQMLTASRSSPVPIAAPGRSKSVGFDEFV